MRRALRLPAAAFAALVVLVAFTAGGVISSAFTSVSAATARFAAANPFIPRNTVAPAVSGTAEEKQTISVSPGSWLYGPTAYTYRWRRCDTSGAGCADIAGATNSSYILTAADIGATVRGVVTASNQTGSASQQSAPTAVVGGGPQSNPPPPTSDPAITGTAAVGRTLTGSDGSWTPAPDSYAYQWLRCATDATGCTAITGATTASYSPVAGDAGSTLRFRVTATNGGGSGTAVSAVSAATIDVPQATTAPSVVGSAQGGQTLTAAKGAWTGSPTSYAYRWRRCDTTAAGCTDITGATTGTYTLTTADVGATVRVQVTATNAAGTGTASSAPTATVRPSYQASVLADDPSEFWRMNGSTTATTGPNGALNGNTAWTPAGTGPVATDPSDASLSLTPAGTYATIDNPTWQKAQTVELWFKTSQRGGLIVEQVGAPFLASWEYVPWLYVDSNGLLRGGQWDGAIEQVISTTTVTDNRWHQAVLEHTTSRLTLYLDGSLAGTRPLASGWAPAGAMTMLGNGWAKNWPYAGPAPSCGAPCGNGPYTDYAGSLADLSLYPTVLSAARVQAHWAAAH